MKPVAILLVSVVLIAVILWVCFLPPRTMPDYVIGDDKCDLCGEPAVYRVWIEGRYLKTEYCRAHRWMGIVNSEPMNRVMNVFLGAGVFGVIYSILSLLKSKQQRELDDGTGIGER